MDNKNKLEINELNVTTFFSSDAPSVLHSGFVSKAPSSYGEVTIRFKMTGHVAEMMQKFREFTELELFEIDEASKTALRY